MTKAVPIEICPGLTKIGPQKYLSRYAPVDPRTGKQLDKTRTHKAFGDREARRKHEDFCAEVDKKLKTGDEWTLAEACQHMLAKQTFGSRRVLSVHTQRFCHDGRGDRRLSEISTREWQRMIAALPERYPRKRKGVLETMSVDTANHHLTTLRKVYREAQAVGRLGGDNTALAVAQLETKQDEGALLRDAELGKPKHKALLGNALPIVMAALLRLFPHCFYPLYRMQLLLGLRFGEVSAIQWRDIDFETGCVTIRRQQLSPEKGIPGAVIAPIKTKKRPVRYVYLGAEGIAFARAHKATMERLRWPGHELWCFPRRPYEKGPRLAPLRIASGGTAPGNLWSRSWSTECLHRAFAELGDARPTSATHTFRHTNATLTEQYTSDAMERSVQLRMAGHGEQSRKAYVDPSAYEATATRLAERLDQDLAGVVGAHGTRHGTPVTKLQVSRGKRATR